MVTTTVASFDDSDGQIPLSGLVADANGDVFGTTLNGGGPEGRGVVYEIANTGKAGAPVYAASPAVVATFNGRNGSDPSTGLLIDAKGDLFGTDFLGGASYYDGEVYEIQNIGTRTAPAYSANPIVVASFDGPNGSDPESALVADANGDLFGTTKSGGANGDGEVFEIRNTGTRTTPVYSSGATVVANFDGTDGSGAKGALIADANGNLFGMTSTGGASGDGEVFEIGNAGTPTAPDYAASPTVIASFDGADGDAPQSSLIADANGDLFGTTQWGEPTARARCSRSRTPGRRRRLPTRQARPSSPASTGLRPDTCLTSA